MASVLLASVLLPPQALPGTAACAFRALTGKSCPGCGLTRAFCCISRGRFHAAWNHNPFGLPLYALTVFFLLFPWLNRLWPQTGRAMRRAKLGVWLPLVMLAAFWLFGMVRLLRECGVLR
jgi:hypothetical protein